MVVLQALFAQHAPVGTGHGFGEHDPPLVHVPEHVGEVLTEHTPLRQQAPLTHGSGAQVLPGNPQVPAPHAACVLTEQVWPVQQLAARLLMAAPPGVEVPIVKAVPLPGRHRPTAIEPVPGASSLVKRKLNIVPQRSTLALWSLPLPWMKVATLKATVASS